MQSKTILTLSCAVVLALLMPTAASAHSALPDHEVEWQQLGDLIGGLVGGGGDAGADSPDAMPGDGGPVAPPAPPGANDWSGPGLLVSPQVVIARLAGPRDVGVVMADRALPWTYHLDTALIERFGQAALVQAVAAWDGIPGSRWATRLGGTVSGVREAGDGRSVIFLQTNCPSGIAGLAYLTPHGGRYQEYGDATFVTAEGDIGICSGLRPAHLAQVLRHEVGHIMGMAHLCDQGDTCWADGMGTASQACRIMYSGSAQCSGQRAISDADLLAVRALYPTLRRAAGPSRVETAARASRGAHAPESARRVFLVRGDGDGLVASATAAVAGQLGAPMLLAIPTAEQCVGGASATELLRVGRTLTGVSEIDGVTVHLVGAWPAGCVEQLGRRGYDAQPLGGGDPIATSLALADLLVAITGPAPAAVLVSDVADGNGTSPDGIAAGAAAAAAGGPLLYTGGSGLDPRVASWLEQRGIARVWLVGGGAALSHRVHVDAEGAGATVARMGGLDRIDTARVIASDTTLFPAPTAVGIASATSWADAASATAVAGRVGAPILLTGRAVDARVDAWLAARHPVTGWVFGGEAAVPWTTAARYTAHVG